MKSKSHLFSILFIILFQSCDKNNEPLGVKFPTLNNIVLKDVGNANSGEDINVSFSLGANWESVTSGKLAITKDDKTLSLAEAQNLAGSKIADFTPNRLVNFDLPSEIKDSDGNLLIEDVVYNIYILLEIGDAGILSSPVSITTTNETVVRTLAQLDADEDISLDSDGNIYVNGGSKSENAIYKVTPSGEFSKFSTSLAYPVGNCFDGEGNLMVTNFQSTEIVRITPTGTSSVLVSDDRLTGGGGIVTDNNGFIYNTFVTQDKIYKISREGEVEEFLKSELLKGPIGLAFDEKTETLYIANYADGKILKLNKDNTLTEIADVDDNIAHLSLANEHFYVSGILRHKVYKLTLDGNLVETVGTGEASSKDGPISIATFNSPNGIEATPDGKVVYVTQYQGSNLRKIILKRF